MSLPYWDATSDIRLKPSDRYKSDWEAYVKRQYDNAYNWFDIEKETAIGSQEYESMKIRLNSVLNPGTGLQLSDDWQALIFDVGFSPQIGLRYKYKDNIWITVNIQKYSTPTDNCIIHRCNNYLALTDKFGNLHKEPCVIDPALKYGNIYYNNSVDIPQGSIVIWLQLNQYTKDIYVNDRFLIGYNEAYRVKNVINYLSDNTFNVNGSPLIKIEAYLDPIQIGDDFTTRITSNTPVVEAQSDATNIGITPINCTILQGITQTFTCNAYVGDSTNSDKFTFELISNNIPIDRYEFTIIDDNNFSIKNIKKYTSENLVVKCTNNTNNNFKLFNFVLGGAF